MSRKEKNDSQNDKAEEPQEVSKTIRVFNSFEEMDRYDHQQYAKMTPEERLHTVFKMRKAFWPDQQNQEHFGKHIHTKK